MEEKEISIASCHTRMRFINGKKIQIDYEEVLQPNGRTLIRYKTLVDEISLPLEFVISKEILQTIHKNHDHSIYSDIPDSILEWFQEFTSKSFSKPIIQNGKPVPSYKVLEWA